MMVNNMGKTALFTGIGFILGISSGIGIGILITKNKYSKKAEDEIASIRKVYNDHLKEIFSNNKKDDNVQEVITPEKEPANMPKYSDKGQLDYSKIYKSDGNEIPQTKPSIDYSKLGDQKEKMKNIYLISPEEFRESPYRCVSLIYYADKILADDDNNVIHVPEELIGEEALSSFGRYEDDCVYVRDDNKKVDYEVILSDKTFQEIISTEDDPKYP